MAATAKQPDQTHAHTKYRNELQLIDAILLIMSKKIIVAMTDYQLIPSMLTDLAKYV